MFKNTDGYTTWGLIHSCVTQLVLAGIIFAAVVVVLKALRII